MLRYLCELAGSSPLNLLSEEQALLTMVSNQQALDLRDLLTTNRGSRVRRSNIDLTEAEEVAVKCGNKFPTCSMSRLDILRCVILKTFKTKTRLMGGGEAIVIGSKKTDMFNISRI